MASHRKSRPVGTRVAGIRTPALATAALTSVALLSQSANAAPADDKPSLEEVEKKVDDLYRQAESATDNYNAAKEKTAKQRKQVDTLLDDVARRTEKLNEARQELGSFAAAQYRTGAAAPDTATFLLADTPQDYFDQTQLMGRLTNRQKGAVDDYVSEQSATMKKRQEASQSLQTLTETQSDLKTAKATVQKKLADAREMLSELTAQEKARLAALEKQKQEAAARKAAELARQQAAAEKAAQEATAPQESTSTAADSSYATKAAKALAFVRAQIGKPYVWGATGPDSYDCSGLTQAAWKAAGVDLPRVTYDQVNAGTTVSLADAQPGDLVFFYDDISHVGLYIGNGMMIHAPKPGAYVREESIYYDGESAIHSVVRPA
ncbi:C40 family peptidase [Streptomyces canus]|uniref:C40 family peptidase n=1 Tax=Streptomyces canus TaxID=58343 RepID=UPI00278B3768|nr:C40 family peptidase [Streptomyces canus]MDQ0763336.1 cell wall-associated NlpC family hydrolase [Streptomyces canus]MDQ1068179.1 cell wall-associated NlpC family hydrolase [Streptomyces canus]